MTCTFFGHCDSPETIRDLLHNTLVDCIENKGIDVFYVGNQGNFDQMARLLLRQLQEKYAFRYYVVLAYRPIDIKEGSSQKDFHDTIYPEVLTTIHPRFAIDKRNRWMLDQSDIVITYVTRSIGGACKFENIAQKKGKTVIRLAEIYSE